MNMGTQLLSAAKIGYSAETTKCFRRKVHKKKQGACISLHKGRLIVILSFYPKTKTSSFLRKVDLAILLDVAAVNYPATLFCNIYTHKNSFGAG
jgi:hypothetical protein